MARASPSRWPDGCTGKTDGPRRGYRRRGLGSGGRQDPGPVGGPRPGRRVPGSHPRASSVTRTSEPKEETVPGPEPRIEPTIDLVALAAEAAASPDDPGGFL